MDKDDIDALFNAQLWTLEQVLSWMFTHDQELVAQNSGEALAALAERYKSCSGNYEAPLTPLAEFLTSHPDQLKAYGRQVRRLLYELKEGKLVATGFPAGRSERVNIEPKHWADYTIEPGPAGLLSDSMAPGRPSPGSSR
jgi:hypothetical protein